MVYECRSLERQISKHVIHMRGGRPPPGASDGGGGGANGVTGATGQVPIDMSEPSSEERARVDGILKEAEDPDYWFLASKDGNREGHYRGESCWNWWAVTVVFHTRGCTRSCLSPTPPTLLPPLPTAPQAPRWAPPSSTSWRASAPRGWTAPATANTRPRCRVRAVRATRV